MIEVERKNRESESFKGVPNLNKNPILGQIPNLKLIKYFKFNHL